MAPPRLAFLCVPFIWNDEQLAFAVETLRTVQKARGVTEIIAVVNGIKDDEFYRTTVGSFVTVMHYNDRNNLARAWNRGISLALERGATHVVVSNLDVLYHPDYFFQMASFVQRFPNAVLWSGCGTGSFDDLEVAAQEEEVVADEIDFASFVCDGRLFPTVGPFDERFEPAYFEDADMLYRIKCAGLSVKRTKTARFFHYHSHTVTSSQGNPELMSMIDTALKKNAEVYEAKWGGPPHGEVFVTPYNGKTGW